MKPHFNFGHGLWYVWPIPRPTTLHPTESFYGVGETVQAAYKSYLINKTWYDLKVYNEYNKQDRQYEEEYNYKPFPGEVPFDQIREKAREFTREEYDRIRKLRVGEEPVNLASGKSLNIGDKND